ncbi:hypothetical protein ACE4RU_03605 [Actinobacillus seminis]|uniref:hypothetical protein n=1 Tax=Actinobacillus seminis TaxID=722 RepID=UPI003B94B962
MAEYKQASKQKAVNFYFKHHKNPSLTLRHFNLSNKTVRLEISQYKYLDVSGSVLQNVFMHYQMQSYQGFSAKRRIKLKRLSLIKYQDQSFE